MDSFVAAYWVSYLLGFALSVVILYFVIRGAILSALAADRTRRAALLADHLKPASTGNYWPLGPEVAPAAPPKPVSQDEQIAAQAEEVARLRAALRQEKLARYTRDDA